jgi:anti-sigma factor RsiW
MARDERQLHAYHDGELGWLSRLRFERRLARSPALRRELASLEALRELAAVTDAGAPTPDLWADIALRLPAADAARQQPAEAGSRAWGLPLRPIAAAAAVAAAVVALALGMWVDDNAPAAGGVVRWIDPGPNSVMVLEDTARDATIIWVLDDSPQMSRGTRRDVA